MTDFLNELVKMLEAKPFFGGWYEAKCPFHEDEHPSLMFRERVFTCMACGATGTLEQLAAQMKDGKNA